MPKIPGYDIEFRGKILASGAKYSFKIYKIVGRSQVLIREGDSYRSIKEILDVLNNMIWE